MYLKRLEIQGFKSFADKVELEFNSGITVVVGPNGSGKSNVVDAIRWVLGEQSAKTLRGLRMEDIIFSGTNKRRPLGLAQVSLTMDNSSGIFPLDYSEVTVTRRLYRSGESEYLINKVPCRMKDIHQLFMDTGMGKEGFSVIGQGKIDEILSLKAEDRRSLIEEAAGIVKYRYRKKEAERKLDDTEQSIIRINDIVGELSEQLGPLEEQAEKAKQYQNWKNELDQLEISIAIEDIKQNEIKEKEIKELLVKAEDGITEANTKYLQISSQFEKERFFSQELDQTIAALQQKFYDSNSAIEQEKHLIEISGERKKGILSQLNRVKLDIDGYKKQKESLAKDIEEKRTQLTQIVNDYQEGMLVVKELSGALSEQKVIYSNSSVLIEDYKSQVIDVLQKKANLNNQVSRLNSDIEILLRRNENLEEKYRKIKMDLVQLNKEQQHYQTEQNRLLEVRNVGEATIVSLQEKINKNNQLLEEIKKEIQQKQLIYQQSFSRLQFLEEMEETGEGYQQGVRSILEGRARKNIDFRGIVGTVADIITVPVKLETALETALGGALQYIITEDDNSAQKIINYLKTEKKGRATFLPLNTIKSPKNAIKLDYPEVLGRAVDLIKFDGKYQAIMEQLLGRVWVIKDLKSLMDIGKRTNFSFRMVTLEGEVITSGGALTGGNYRKQRTGLLTRKRIIKELSEELVAKNNELETRKQKTIEYEQFQSELNNKINTQKELLHNNQLILTDLENKMSYLNQEINRKREEITEINLEREEIQEQISINEKERDRFLKESEHIEILIFEKENQISSLQESIKELAAVQDGLVEDLNEKKIKIATLEQTIQMNKEQIAILEKNLHNIAEQKCNLAIEKENLESKAIELEDNILQTEQNVYNLTRELVNLEEEIKLKKEQRIDLQEFLISLEKELKQKQTVIDQLKNDSYQHKMKLAKIEMEVTASREKLNEQFGYEYSEALKLKVEIDNKRSVTKKINELKVLISDLGLVNFAAINESGRVRQRLEFLTKQLTDLKEAKNSLLKVIKDMDQIMIKKFRDTYNQVNVAFSSVFNEMFGGGSAALELSDADNLLDTGIEIIAQPPGKKPQTLSLLSGGERAMTAIALLFAILKVKPSPFCVLDEIEAALDEANVERFSLFLKQFVHKTQFIIISHRKGTMEAADVLYGVTIEEETGVSKLISVKLNEAV